MKETKNWSGNGCIRHHYHRICFLYFFCMLASFGSRSASHLWEDEPGDQFIFWKSSMLPPKEERKRETLHTRRKGFCGQKVLNISFWNRSEVPLAFFFAQLQTDTRGPFGIFHHLQGRPLETLPFWLWLDNVLQSASNLRGDPETLPWWKSHEKRLCLDIRIPRSLPHGLLLCSALPVRTSIKIKGTLLPCLAAAWEILIVLALLLFFWIRTCACRTATAGENRRTQTKEEKKLKLN